MWLEQIVPLLLGTWRFKFGPSHPVLGFPPSGPLESWGGLKSKAALRKVKDSWVQEQAVPCLSPHTRCDVDSGKGVILGLALSGDPLYF